MKVNEEIYPNIFLQNENDLWGCIDENGKIIIPCKYDIISLCEIADGKQILCGRGGKIYTGYISKGYFSEEEVKTVYTGVYDLYSLDGRLKIGGFIEFNYNKAFKAYLFKFGNNYRYREGKGTKLSPYKFMPPSGEWIILSSWFQFVRGFSYTYLNSLPSNFWITSNNSLEGATLQYKNGYLYGTIGRVAFEPIVISDNVLYDDIIFVNSTTILCKGGRAKSYSYRVIYVNRDHIPLNSHPVFNGNTIISSEYRWMKVLDEHYTFVYDKDKIGLLKDGLIAIPCECSFITRPLSGRCFAAIKYPFILNKEGRSIYFVVLCKVYERYIKPSKDIIIAIDKISEDLLIKMFFEGDFLLIRLKMVYAKLHHLLFRIDIRSILTKISYS